MPGFRCHQKVAGLYVWVFADRVSRVFDPGILHHFDHPAQVMRIFRIQQGILFANIFDFGIKVKNVKESKFILGKEMMNPTNGPVPRPLPSSILRWNTSEHHFLRGFATASHSFPVGCSYYTLLMWKFQDYYTLLLLFIIYLLCNRFIVFRIISFLCDYVFIM